LLAQFPSAIESLTLWIQTCCAGVSDLYQNINKQLSDTNYGGVYTPRTSSMSTTLFETLKKGHSRSASAGNISVDNNDDNNDNNNSSSSSSNNNSNSNSNSSSSSNAVEFAMSSARTHEGSEKCDATKSSSSSSSINASTTLTNTDESSTTDATHSQVDGSGSDTESEGDDGEEVDLTGGSLSDEESPGTKRLSLPDISSGNVDVLGRARSVPTSKRPTLKLRIARQKTISVVCESRVCTQLACV
jgi:hypothetical protein